MSKESTTHYDRIRKIREKKNIAGTDIANKLHISPQYYYDIEKGERNLSADIVVQLAEIFETTTDYLLGVSDIDTSSMNHFQSTTRKIVGERIYQLILDELN